MSEQKVKFHPNGKKKKEIRDILKNNREFKLIINYDSTGNILSIMEKPNLKKMDLSILASGAHVFANPEHNHCDFFQSGALIYKEYPKNRTNYGYTLSGGAVII